MSQRVFLGRVARPFVALVERYYPDPFVFLIVLTSLAFVLALALTPASPDAALQAWGDGLAGLLSFMAQIALTLLTAHALAHTDPVVRGLHQLARVPSSVRGCYAMVALIACLCSLLAWSFGLVAGALIARAVARSASQRGLRVHYPLLVASAYSGIAVWHMGYSGSAPLFVATPGHEMLDWIGVLPISETLLRPFNLMAIVVTVTALVWVCPLLHPAEPEVQTAQGELIQATEPGVTAEAGANGPQTFARRLDNNRVFTLILGLLLAAYLGRYFALPGAALNLNIVNWTFLTLGLLLSRSAAHYVALILAAGKTVGAVFIQYPFYAGIMGLMSGTGLVQVMAAWFTAIASAQTLPFWAFLAGGLVNLFVPSGGGQWAVQGPVFLQAAAGLGVDPALIVLGVAYGDQWSNLIQPFWTIPLLAIAGLHMRHIMGYCFVLFLVTGVTLGGAILMAGYWQS